MVRTRDFVLFLLAVVFLLLAIVGTQWWYGWRSLPIVGNAWSDNEVSSEYAAEVPAKTDDRASRIESLRAKVSARLAARDEVIASAPETPEPEPRAADTAATTTATETTVVVKTCSGYQPLTVPWTPQALLQENREGVRVYYERGLPDPLSSSTPETIRAIVPLRSWPAGSPTCLPTDVIGVAMDGSLIRNDELALYTVFGADTLIGYSLDGFPIYGPSNVTTDACGGAMVGGTYRYVLDSERAGLITCFSATPTRIN